MRESKSEVCEECRNYLCIEEGDAIIDLWCRKSLGHEGDHETRFLHKVKRGQQVTTVSWRRNMLRDGSHAE